MGFIIFFVAFAAFLLVAWIMVLKTRIRHLEDMNAHLKRSMQPVALAEKSCCGPEAAKVPASAPCTKPVVKPAAESVPVAVPTKVARGVILKCGKAKCVVKWSDGKYEKLTKDKVQELLLSGELMVAPNKKVALHNF